MAELLKREIDRRQRPEVARSDANFTNSRESECNLALCSVLSLSERSRYNRRLLAEYGDTIRFDRSQVFAERKRWACPIHAHFGQFLTEEAQVPYQQLACAPVSYRKLRVIRREGYPDDVRADRRLERRQHRAGCHI